MERTVVMELLKNFRCYEYAAMNCGPEDGAMPLVISERKRNLNMWDRSRYNRIVAFVRGAVDHCLSDEQRTIITRRYLNRNPQTFFQIALDMRMDRGKVSKLHNEAIHKLSIALEPLNEDEMEITPFHHMWQKKIPS